MDNFGVKKYVREENKTHLIEAFEESYTMSKYETWTKYVGLTLDWNYEWRQVHLYIPGYVEKALQQFQHRSPGRVQNQPHPHIPLNHGTRAKVEYAKPGDKPPRLPKEGKTNIQ